MTTTNLIVDFLVIGLSSFAWVIPLIVAIVGPICLSDLKDIEVMIIPFTIGLSYILGISIDRLADDITAHWNNKIHDEIFPPNDNLTYHNRLNEIVYKSDSARVYLSYRRSVIRITRSCVFNFSLGILVWIVAYFLQTNFLSLDILLLIISIFIVITIFSFREWSSVSKGYFSIVRDMYNSFGTNTATHENAEIIG